MTGYDILFFWVARMIMAGLRFTGRVPFSVVHLHGLVRVGGEKMSKTRGNVIDPLEAIAEFGADAVRFTLASAAASGPTVSVERGRMAGSRNFATKLWNAARFTLGQIDGNPPPRSLEGRVRSLPDRWILSRLAATAEAVNRNLAAFRFDEAAQAVYRFVWHELCDGYVEMIKPLLSASAKATADESASASARAAADGSAESAADGSASAGTAVSARAPEGGTPGGRDADRDAAREILARCLGDSLAMLHPFMPFVTEEIWEKLTGRPGTLIVAPYPEADTSFSDETAERIVETLRALVTRVRSFRSERGFSPTEPVRLAIDPASPERDRVGEIEPLAPLLKHLARLSDLSFDPPPPEMARDVVSGLSIGFSVAERAAGGDGRLAQKLAALDEEIAELSAKLHNPSFLDKAPPPVVEKTRRRLVELEERRSALSTGGA